jgi:guanine deaminase
MIYTAIYEESCDVAFEAARDSGLRAIMGKMMMDVDSYGQLQPSKIASVSLAESERLCRKWHGADNDRLEYAFSPRFALTCSEELMRGAAELAKRFDAYVQTHLSENREEVKQVRHLFPWASDYTHVYEQCGLLTPKTVLGHCIHLNTREIEAIATAESSVAHCPTSNFFLGSGLMKLDELMKAGIAVGLGSDVAGGPELNMWQVMRAAIEVQQARAAYETSVPSLRVSEAFYLATQGGARALEKEETIGTLDPGKEADVIVVDLASLLPYQENAPVVSELSAEDALALSVYRGGPGATLETYVRGKCVYQARKLGRM